jgi:hypothetical protein
MTPEDLGLPNSATRIERMGDGPLEASGLHPGVNRAARRAGLTPNAWVSAASGEHSGLHPASYQAGVRRGISMGARSGAHFGFRYGLEDGSESTPEDVREHIHATGSGGYSSDPHEPGEGTISHSSPRFAHNLGPHPAERWAAGNRWATADELAI